MNTKPSIRRASPLSAQQWRTLEALARNAREAVENLHLALLLNAADTSDTELQTKLMETADRVNGSLASLSGLPYMLHCQPEWLGGDSMEAKNHVLREPHLMGMRRLTVNE